MTEGNEFHPPKIYAIWVDARPESPMAGLSGFLSENSRRLFFTERGDAELKIRDMEALRLNRHPAAEYRCVEYPGGYDAERSIQAELLKTISLQADPEIMRYEVTDRIYGNTGGGCMVGTLAVRLPDLDKTIWINCNDEGVTITSADYVWNEDDSGSWERYEDVVMLVIHGSAAETKDYERAIILIGSAWGLDPQNAVSHLELITREKEAARGTAEPEETRHVLPESELPMNASGMETLDNVCGLFETAIQLESRDHREALFRLASKLMETQNLLDWIEKTPEEQELPELAES